MVDTWRVKGVPALTRLRPANVASAVDTVHGEGAAEAALDRAVRRRDGQIAVEAADGVAERVLDRDGNPECLAGGDGGRRLGRHHQLRCRRGRHVE